MQQKSLKHVFGTVWQKLNSRFFKNTGWIMGAQIVQLLIGFIVGIASARYLGPSNYGAITYTLSFVTFFTCVVNLGMEGVIIKKMIKHPDEEGMYLGGGILLRFLSSVVSAVCIVIIVGLLNGGDRIKIVLAFLQSFQLVFLSFHLLDSWFQKNLNAKYVSISKMVSCVLVALFRIFLLATGKSIVWFALTNGLSYAIIAVQLVFYYKKNGGQSLKADVSKGVEVLSESYHFIISGLAVAIYGQMDKMMLGQMLSDAEVGLYATATHICSMWIFVPQAVINSARPIIMTLKHNGDEQRYMLRLKQLYSGIIWLCIAFSLGIVLFSDWAIVLLYGKAFAGAADVLKIYIWSEVFSMIGVARGIWIISENKNRYVKYYLVIGAVVNVVLNLALIPVIGMSGAAVATVITQIVTSLLAPLLFKETREHFFIVMQSIWPKSIFKKI